MTRPHPRRRRPPFARAPAVGRAVGDRGAARRRAADRPAPRTGSAARSRCANRGAPVPRARHPRQRPRRVGGRAGGRAAGGSANRRGDPARRPDQPRRDWAALASDTLWVYGTDGSHPALRRRDRRARAGRAHARRRSAPVGGDPSASRRPAPRGSALPRTARSRGGASRRADPRPATRGGSLWDFATARRAPAGSSPSTRATVRWCSSTRMPTFGATGLAVVGDEVWVDDAGRRTVRRRRGVSRRGSGARGRRAGRARRRPSRPGTPPRRPAVAVLERVAGAARARSAPAHPLPQQVEQAGALVVDRAVAVEAGARKHATPRVTRRASAAGPRAPRPRCAPAASSA